jgi:hypothetical protein
MKCLNQSLFTGHSSNGNIKNAQPYSWPDVYQSQNTEKLVEAVIEFDRNPFDACISTANHENTNIIIFNIGSHNHGLSFVEAKHSAKQLVAKFMKWSLQQQQGKQKVKEAQLLKLQKLRSNGGGSSSNNNKASTSYSKEEEELFIQASQRQCIIFVSMPDSHHEYIKLVDGGKFGDQAHFRNSFRSNLFNKVFNRTLEIEKVKLKKMMMESHNLNGAEDNDDGEDDVRIHYLDLFQLTLGLHWLGHVPRTTAKGFVYDPVHFHPTPTYYHLISAVWHSAWELCM